MKRSRRFAWLMVVGLCLVVIAGGIREYHFARPEGSGPAGPAVDVEPFRRVWTDRRVLLLGIGDSVTAGLGAKRPERSYFQRLVRNPDDEFAELRDVCLGQVLPNLTTQNIAVSGSTSLYHADAIQEKVAVQPEDVFGLVVLTTGGNDLIHSYGRAPPREGAMYGATLAQARPWIERFGRRLDAMLADIAARFPGGCEIYLADIYDPTDGVGDAPSVYLPAWRDGLAIHAEYNRTIREVAARHDDVYTVPLHATFLGHGSHCRQFWRSTYDRRDPHYWYYHNIEDPNDRGYDAIRRTFLNVILANTQLRKES